MATKKKAEKVEEVVDTQQAEKLKALEHALADLDKQFGKGSVMKLGSDAISQNIPVVSTGCLTLDAALGVGGIPRGRVVEIYGPESSGKTTVALHIVAEAQKAGGIAAFVDAEHALDPMYAKKLGVNIDELYVSQPDTGEQALEIAEALVRSGALDVVVIDSATAQKYVADNAGLKIVEDSTAFEGEEYAIAVKKGNTELLNMINAEIEKMLADGTISAIAADYT